MSHEGVKRGLSFLYPKRLAELSGVSATASQSSPPSKASWTGIPAGETLSTVQKLELMDFLIASAGFPVDESTKVEFAKTFRLPIESIIQEDHGVFEALFREIKKEVDAIRIIEAQKGQDEQKKSEAEIIAEARDKAMKTLGTSAWFGVLGAYHNQDSEYYFEQNALATNLSKYFVTELYSDVTRADIMLRSQLDKTKGQLEGMEEEVKKLLPISYNRDLSELALIEEYFDLFLIEPRILDIARILQTQGNLKNLPSTQALLTRSHQLVDLSDFEESLKDLFNTHKSLKINLEEMPNLNSIEKLFYLHYKLLPQLKAEINSSLLPRKAELEEKVKTRKTQLQKAITDVKKPVKKAPGKPADKIDIRAALTAAFDTDAELQELNRQIAEIDAHIQDAQIPILGLEDLLKNLRTRARHRYAGVVKAADGLSESFKALKKSYADIEQLVKKGGNYSCLSFIPIVITDRFSGMKSYECLVALSGMEPDSATNPHKVLGDFAHGLRYAYDDKIFNFRYVGPSSTNLDLMLEQVGKGLSGQVMPLARHKHATILPDFDKQCAEKRLVSELLKLFAVKGLSAKILGCDNLALPIHKDIEKFLDEQKRLREAAEAAARKAEEEAAARKAAEEAAARKALEQAAQAAQNVVEEIQPTPEPKPELKQQPKKKNEKKPAPLKAKASSAKPEKETEAAEDTSFHAIKAPIPGKGVVGLRASHIPCCKSCQAQKPAVMTVLFHTIQQSERMRRAQEVLMQDAMTVPNDDLKESVNCRAEIKGTQPQERDNDSTLKMPV